MRVLPASQRSRRLKKMSVPPITAQIRPCTAAVLATPLLKWLHHFKITCYIWALIMNSCIIFQTAFVVA